MNKRGNKRGKKRSLSQVQSDKESEIDLPDYPPMGRVMKYREPAESTRIKEMAVGYQKMVDYQRRSVFYFEEKQKVHVERYSDRNVKQKTETKFPQFVKTLKGVRSYIPPDLQKVMTRGTPLAKLVDKYHEIKARNPDVRRCTTLKEKREQYEAKKAEEEQEKKKKKNKKKKKKKKDEEEEQEEETKEEDKNGTTLKQKIKVIFESASDTDSEDEENELQLSDNDEEKQNKESDDEEDFNDYAQDYVGEVEEDDADS